MNRVPPSQGEIAEALRTRQRIADEEEKALIRKRIENLPWADNGAVIIGHPVVMLDRQRKQAVVSLNCTVKL